MSDLGGLIRSRLKKDELVKVEFLVGKEVSFNTCGSWPKSGIIQDMTNNGILFRITKTHPAESDSAAKLGMLMFVSYSNGLQFTVVDESF